MSYLYSLTGDDVQALTRQRDVYQHAVKRWGANSQYALVELLNLGSSEGCVANLVEIAFGASPAFQS